MKILHIGLASHYTEHMLYQDNILSEINFKQGHEVVYISDTYAYINGKLESVNECDMVLNNGVRLIRVKYDRIFNEYISNKIQKARIIKKYLYEINPDSILYHGVCGYELMDVAKYVNERKIPLYIDSHENFKNTAMTWVSKIAYKYIHGFFVRRALPCAKKVLYVGYPEKEYLKEMYHISEEKLEYFPLGGVLVSSEKQEEFRRKMIAEMDFPSDVIICAHSGKMNKGKKTEEILQAFMRVKDSRLRLVIYGSFDDDVKHIIEPMIEHDERVHFLGWKNAEEQEEILSATDLYIQPGTYSATAQIALCCGCVLIVNFDYRKVMEEAAIYAESTDQIERALQLIINDDNLLTTMKEKGKEIASLRYDYVKLSERYLL